MNPKIAVGQTFPDYVLPDHTKTPRRLSTLQGKADPMLVVLIRGLAYHQQPAPAAGRVLPVPV